MQFVNESNYVFNDIIQEAEIIFNEEGVEASNLIETPGASELSGNEIKIIDFTLDRPFLFIIKSDYNIPLYIGIVTNVNAFNY